MARTRQNAPQTVADAPPMDLAALAASSTESKPTTGGGRFADNPFVPILRESFRRDNEGENGWMENTIPGFHVRDFVAALRHATTVLVDESIGVRIRYAYADDNGNAVKEHGNRDDVPEDGRDVTVKFLGRPRRVRSEDENGNGSDVDGDE